MSCFPLCSKEYAANGQTCLRAVGLEELDFEPEASATPSSARVSGDAAGAGCHFAVDVNKSSKIGL